MHSFDHFYDIIEDTFYHFYLDHLDQNLLQQRRAPHESVIEFWQCFQNLQFQAMRSQMKLAYLWDQLEYCLKKSSRPKRKLEIKPRSTFFIDGIVQSHVGARIVSTDFPPPSHSTVPPSPYDVEDHVHTIVQPSHPLNITPYNFRTNLFVSPSSSHMNYFFDLYLCTQVFL